MCSDHCNSRQIMRHNQQRKRKAGRAFALLSIVMVSAAGCASEDFVRFYWETEKSVPDPIVTPGPSDEAKRLREERVAEETSERVKRYLLNRFPLGSDDDELIGFLNRSNFDCSRSTLRSSGLTGCEFIDAQRMPDIYFGTMARMNIITYMVNIKAVNDRLSDVTVTTHHYFIQP